jgi:hypothetical protein
MLWTRKCREYLLLVLEVRIGIQEIRVGSVATKEEVGLPDGMVFSLFGRRGAEAWSESVLAVPVAIEMSGLLISVGRLNACAALMSEI